MWGALPPIWGETPQTPHVFARPPALFAVPRGTVLCQKATPHSRGMPALFSESFGILCTKDLPLRQAAAAFGAGCRGARRSCGWEG